MTADPLRARLEARSTDELIDILRERDTEEWQPAVFPLVEDILQGRGVAVPASRAAEAAETPVEDFVPIASFATVVESEACRSALVAAGFHVAAPNQYLLQVDPGLGPALSGLRLAVPASEADDARAFLAAAEQGELSAGLLVCGACGSQDVQADRTVSRAGTFALTALVGPVIQDASISYRCRQCGQAWS